MEAHRRLLFISSLFFIIIISFLAITSPPLKGEQVYVLRVECGNATLTVPLQGTVKIAYTWIHSVEKTPVTEVYIARPEGLILVEARAESFGAGHPYSSAEIGGGQTRVLENGTIIYEANYNIGGRLEIIGHPDYSGSITVYYNGHTFTCSGFVEAVVSVEKAPARIPGS
ncbi:MAG: DUF1850 domain-containing protein [Desulfurococcales archaeon]|nr:DUF1850 domain-containing protein [Desulfurococcales archaeon]